MDFFRTFRNKIINKKCSYISELPIEILVTIFGFLPLKDLTAVCQTCKLWQQVAFYCYQRNYSATEALVSTFRFKTTYRFGDPKLILDAFISHIQTFLIIDSVLNEIPYFLEKQSKCGMIRTLRFVDVNFTNIGIESMSEILEKLKWLHIKKCKINRNFIANILTSCPNIKYLTLEKNDYIDHEYFDDTNPLIRTFPNLERIEIIEREIEPLEWFLYINPNIRKVAIVIYGYDYSKMFRRLTDFESENPLFAIDELAILNTGSLPILLPQWVGTSFGVLDTMERFGMYKRLKFYCTFPKDSQRNQEIIDAIAEFNPFKLFIEIFKDERPVKLSVWRSIEVLCIACTYTVINLDDIACNCENLEIIQFGVSSLGHIMPFICQAENLTKLRIDRLRIDIKDPEKEKILNLSRLNRERAELSNARKITMYVEEELYLATKWATGQLNLEFIQLKIIESHDWKHDFDKDFEYLDRY